MALLALLLLPWVWMRLFTPAPAPVPLPPLADSAGQWRVYVVDWGYHSSLLVEQPQGWRLGPPGEEDARFVEYGWGDRSFYMESSYWPHALFAALFLPTPSVVYLDGETMEPHAMRSAKAVWRRTLTASELRRLLLALEQEMTRGAAGERPAPFPPAAGYAGRFYPGRESYIFWSNCNSWTLRALDRAGLGGTPHLVFFSPQVGGRLRDFERLK